MKDVAERAGVALGTVSRIVNGNATVAPRLRAHVQAVIAELAFRPNATARSMRLSRTHAVGCVVTDVTQQIAGQMLAGAEAVLRKAGYAMLTASTHNDPQAEAEILSFMAERRVDGVILAVSSDADPALAPRLRALGCPVVLWERNLDWQFDTVLTQHRAGLREATRHLLEAGRRTLTLVAGSRDTWVGREQAGGFREALRETGVKAHDTQILYTDELKPGAFAALLQPARRPSGLIANIHDIPPILLAARAAGCILPRDLALVSVGDAQMLEVLDPPVTAVRGDGALVGRTAADLLLDLIHSDPASHRASPGRAEVPVQIIIRKSSAR